MHFSTNISHMICLAAGCLLVLTGFLLKDLTPRATPAITAPAGSRARRESRSTGVVRRLVLISVGLLGVGYGLLRILGY